MCKLKDQTFCQKTQKTHHESSRTEQTQKDRPKQKDMSKNLYCDSLFFSAAWSSYYSKQIQCHSCVLKAAVISLMKQTGSFFFHLLKICSGSVKQQSKDLGQVMTLIFQMKRLYLLTLPTDTSSLCLRALESSLRYFEWLLKLNSAYHRCALGSSRTQQEQKDWEEPLRDRQKQRCMIENG